MKINKNIMFGIGALVVLAVIFMILKRKPTMSHDGTKFVVYGTEWCGYTTKQRKHLDTKYGPGSHEFVDCDNNRCPPGMNAFPVTKTPNGDMVEGFNTEL